MIRKIAGGMLAAVLACSVVMTSHAHPSAEDAFDYRQHVMTALKGHIGAASMIVRGLIEDGGHLIDHAQGLAKGAAEIHRVFQEGSDIEGSEALPAVWEDPEKFAAAIERAESATEKFVQVISDGGDSAAVGAAFRDVGMSCRGCHDDFRADN